MESRASNVLTPHARPSGSTPAQPVAAPAPPVGPVVEARALVKAYAGRPAVDGIDLDVPLGGVHGLLGPNGAGKTTLLRMLLGLVAPDSGELRVLGATPFGARGALPGVAGFVDAPRFYPYLSAARNLDLLAALDGHPERVSRTRLVDDLLEQVGLGGRAEEKVRGFSTGMRQRLGLAAVLLREPDLLVLDEPTSGLDPAGVDELHRVIREVAAAGRTVLLSSHDMTEVEQLCDAVTILRAGRVVHTGSLVELRARADAPTYLLGTAEQSVARETAQRLGGAVLDVVPGPDGDTLVLSATQEQIDTTVLALAAAGVPVRSLVRRDTALAALFLRLTGPDPETAPETAQGIAP